MDTGSFPKFGRPGPPGAPQAQPQLWCPVAGIGAVGAAPTYFAAKRPHGPLASWCSVCGKHESTHSAAVGDASAGSLDVSTHASTATATPGGSASRAGAEEGRAGAAVDLAAAASRASSSPPLPPPSHRPPPCAAVAVFDFDLTLASMHVGIFDAGNRDRVFGTPQRLAMLKGMLEQAEAAGVPCHIVTRNSEHNVRKALRASGLERFFESIVGNETADAAPKSAIIMDRILR